MQQIRNFSIIAHIDHGKSTLADRLLEVTGTIEKRKMRDQVLDSMDLERERGITIKMQPVRMRYKHGGQEYLLHLIDTPGHIDFSYEVSRALTAVEGAVLLVDATQGVQAQTLTTLRTAQELGLVIIPALSKIDSPLANVDDVRDQVALLLDIDPSEVLLCSGRTGEGVETLLQAVIDRVPPPREGNSVSEKKVGGGGQTAEQFGDKPFSKEQNGPRGLVFDFQYSDHQGVIVYLRMFDGQVKKGDRLEFAATGRNFIALEVGSFSPKPVPLPEGLGAGSIGYVVTGIKEPGLARVGDTVRMQGSKVTPLSGYGEPKAVVWASIYPESQDDFTALRQALGRLRLSDSSLSFEEESSGMLGRGFRCGLLGMLHLEIVTERLRREANLSLVVTTPTITYEVETRDGKRHTVYSPAQFPEYGDIKEVWEPFVSAEIILPAEYMGPLMPLLFEHEVATESTENFSESRMRVKVVMPLRELMRNFFDKLKSVSSGYASISYELRELRLADVARLDMYVAEEIVPAFSRIIAKHRADEEAIAAVEKLYKILPRQNFATKIQAMALGRIVSSRTLSAMSKDVTQHMYGGDITRKMKLREKQKKGKKRMLERGRVNIPEDVFLKMIQSD
ncbi:MAG TPA: GTP-binding protein [Candidatus Paceibacterota bacterium]|nr:GTP-binding protein [Candidatus Paceibacterota bacterium]